MYHVRLAEYLIVGPGGQSRVPADTACLVLVWLRFLPLPNMSTPIFRPLSGLTLSALAGASDTVGRVADSGVGDADLGDDSSFTPAPQRFGADDAAAAAALAPDSESDNEFDGEVGADADADALGEWAADCGGGCGVNLAARLAPRRSGNERHAGVVGGRDRVEERLDRVEDRRRESQARDKLDRATVEQVLDPRTRMILFRLLSRGRLASIDGCVSTGKEANVYYGTAPPGAATIETVPGSVEAGGEVEVEDVAVKVFKTSILSFKDRERYVAGEFRFRRGGYNRQSNRKMVQQWAEKEFRNLVRLRDAGVPAPDPLVIKPPVLVMRFFGRDGWPAPRLKDANIPADRLTAAYADTCVLMRRMYRRARLVHGDLSEYNILYHKRQVVIIDVSQSVEDDHPMALDFLRRDCVNVNDFFARNGVSPVLGQRELFDFVTREDDVPTSFVPIPEVTESQVVTSGDADAKAGMNNAAGEEIRRRRDVEDAHTRDLFSMALQTADARTEDERVRVAADDVVFHQSFIPRTLDDIYTGDTDMHRSTTQDPESRELYARLAGAAGSTIQGDEEDSSSSPGMDRNSGESDGGSVCGSDGDGENSSDSWYDESKMSPEEIKAARKANKKQVKAEARDRRETKTPKHVKKRRDVVAKRRRHVKTKK